jgi:hypothetical protein
MKLDILILILLIIFAILFYLTYNIVYYYDDKQYFDKQYFDKQYFDKQYFDKQYFDKQYFDKQYFETYGNGEGSKKPKQTNNNETSIILILKTPDGVHEAKKKFIASDTQAPHLTLGTLKEGFDEQKVINHLKSIKPIIIKFDKWKHTKTFIGLIPSNINDINDIVNPIKSEFRVGPRGGYHMSLAYRSHSKPLDPITFKSIHSLVETPMECPIKEIHINKRYIGESWYNYKTIKLN